MKKPQRANKITIKRLKKMAKPFEKWETNIYTLLLKLTTSAEYVLDLENEGYKLDPGDYENGFYRIHEKDNVFSIFYMAKPYEKKYFAGLRTKHERLVQTTFTHGNNQLMILDINALVRRMAKEKGMR